MSSIDETVAATEEDVPAELPSRVATAPLEQAIDVREALATEFGGFISSEKLRIITPAPEKRSVRKGECLVAGQIDYPTPRHLKGPEVSIADELNRVKSQHGDVTKYTFQLAASENCHVIEALPLDEVRSIGVFLANRKLISILIIPLAFEGMSYEYIATKLKDALFTKSEHQEFASLCEGIDLSRIIKTIIDNQDGFPEPTFLSELFNLPRIIRTALVKALGCFNKNPKAMTATPPPEATLELEWPTEGENLQGFRLLDPYVADGVRLLYCYDLIKVTLDLITQKDEEIVIQNVLIRLRSVNLSDGIKVALPDSLQYIFDHQEDFNHLLRIAD